MMDKPAKDFFNSATVIALVMVVGAFVLFNAGKNDSNQAQVLNGDTTPPTVAIVAPAPGPVSGTVAITVAATDAGGISHVEIRRGFNAFTANAVCGNCAKDANGNYTYVFNTDSYGNGTYTFQAIAYDNANNAATSLPVAYTKGVTAGTGGTTGGTTGGGATVSSSGVSNLRVTSAQPTSLTLAWANGLGGEGTAGYNPYGYTLYVNGVLKATNNTTSYMISGLSGNTTYTIAVKAKDSTGAESAAATISATTSASDTQGPSPVYNFLVTSKTMTSITVSWSPSTDNVGVANYRLYKNGALAGTSTSTTYTYTGLTAGTTYSLVARAFDAAGNFSDASPTIAATTSTTTNTGPDTQAPSAPGPVTLNGAMAGTADISWGASNDDRGVAGYKIYINGGGGIYDNRNLVIDAQGQGTNAGVPGCSIASYNYYFTVRAYDAAGNLSAPSTTLRAGPSGTVNLGTDSTNPTQGGAIALSLATVNSLSLNWNDATDNIMVAGYDVYMNGVWKTSSKTSDVAIGELSANTSYTISVRARDTAGNLSSAITGTFTTMTGSAGVDTTAPTVSIVAPANGTATSSPITIKVSATDAGGIDHVELYRGYNNNYFYSVCQNCTKGSDGTYQYTWDPSGYGGGTFSFYAKAFDTNNNVSTSPTISIIRQ